MSDPLILTNYEAAEVETSLLCEFVKTLSRHPEMIPEDILLLLAQRVERDNRNPPGYKLLHHVCYALDSHTLSTIRLLVNIGADLNVRGIDCVGVFHILVLGKKEELKDATARLLLELGAHLDLADNQRRTAADYWLERNVTKKKQDLPDWMQEGVPKLLCQCARVIRRYKLPYKEINVLPAVLVPFVSWH